MTEIYDIETAKKEIGKRVIVSIRNVSLDKDDEFSGFWGVIHSVDEEGFNVLVEGGSDEEFKWLPPSLEILEPATYKYYLFNDETPVENVDYEVSLVGADKIEDLDSYFDRNKVLIGDKSKIAFEFISVIDNYAQVNIYLENKLLTFDDNLQWYQEILYGIEADIEKLSKQDLTLQDKFKILPLTELCDLIEQDVKIHYGIKQLTCFFYDENVRSGNFSVYQYIDDLIFFGKLYDDYDLRFCKIRKSEYLALLQELLEVLTNANPNHYVHS